MSGTRLSVGDTEVLARKIALKTLEFESATSALERASALLRAKGLSGPVVERLLSSNPRAAELTLWVLRNGVAGTEGESFENLRSAVSAIGIDTVWRAALVANLVDYALLLLSAADAKMPDLVAQSWASAEMAFWLSDKHIVDPSDAFVQALFADVGVFALFFALPEVYKALARSDTQQPLAEFEQASLGIDHQHIGALILQDLKFPEKIVTFAEKHHKNALEMNMEEKLVKAAYVAVEVESCSAGLRTCAEELSLLILEAALLKESDVPELTSAVQRFLTRTSVISTLELPEAA